MRSLIIILVLTAGTVNAGKIGTAVVALGEGAKVGKSEIERKEADRVGACLVMNKQSNIVIPPQVKCTECVHDGCPCNMGDGNCRIGSSCRLDNYGSSMCMPKDCNDSAELDCQSCVSAGCKCTPGRGNCKYPFGCKTHDDGATVCECECGEEGDVSCCKLPDWRHCQVECTGPSYNCDDPVDDAYGQAIGMDPYFSPGGECEDGPDNAESNVPVNQDVGYAQGSCGVHVTHFQIPEGPDNYYSIKVEIKDGNKNTIGNIDRTKADIPINISSMLPYQLVVTTALPGSVPDTDAEPLSFAYGGDFWNSGDSARCSVGSYENGSRNIDCSFAC